MSDRLPLPKTLSPLPLQKLWALLDVTLASSTPVPIRSVA